MTHTCTACGHIDQINPASIMGSVKSEAKTAAARKNGAAPPKPGSKPRGRPRKNPTLPITKHPDFLKFAGTPSNPLNGAQFTKQGKFAGFADTLPSGERNKLVGIMTFLNPDRMTITPLVPITGEKRQTTKEPKTKKP